MILIPMIKYIFIVLLADNNGDGGTFALYTLISRYAKLSLIPNEQAEDAMLSNYKLETVSPQMKRAQWIKRKLEGSIVAKCILFLLTVLGTSMVIGDGILTPCISSTIAGISIAILVVLFSVQRFGTDKVGYSFAPIILLWFLLLGGIGLYNLIHNNAHVMHAFNPIYIFDYFKRNGKQGWVFLGGVVLCITGSEAMFVNLSHFNVRAIQASRGRLKEDEARKYFQELINAVDYCHSRGVFHRDLKPENLLLDASGTLKVSDFGLSALPQQVHGDGMLHTTCGTPNYVAPEVVKDKGYDGAQADLWSCGVILFVLIAGYLPFEDSNIMSLYKKIFKAEFECPAWFSTSAKKLIKKILDPNPQTRITIAQVIENDWFKKGYQPPRFESLDINLDDVHAIFDEEMGNLVVERRDEKPTMMNAFELIATSQGLNLGILFEKETGLAKCETRFASKLPAKEILAKIEEAAMPLGFLVEKNNYKLKLKGEKTGRKGHLAIATEIFEVAPSLYMVELRKSKGDTLEFYTVYKNLSSGLKDIFWKPNRAD